MKEEYWVCVIGPVNRALVPQGGDFPPRRAAMEQIMKMSGVDDFTCSSGWGVNEETKDAILEAWRAGSRKGGKS